MAQTEIRGVRKALTTALVRDETLKALAPGGVHFKRAPKLNPRTGEPLPDPYVVIRFLATPHTLGNDSDRVLTRPAIRLSVYGYGDSAETQAKVDQAMTYLDGLLEDLIVTVSDSASAAGAAMPVRVDGFFRTNLIDDDEDDKEGNLFTRIVADYSGSAYYLPSD